MEPFQDSNLKTHQCSPSTKRGAEGRAGKIALTQSVMEIDRRKHPRVIVNWPVVVNIPGGSLEGEVKDISIGGVCILPRGASS